MFLNLFQKEKPFLTSDEIKAIEERIALNEKITSAEIRIFIEKKCRFVDALDRCKEVFENLKMEKTVLRNSVLLYIAHKDRQIGIYGDIAINKAVGLNYWEKTIERLVEAFKNEKYEKGILLCLNEIGNKLKKHFPIEEGDINELSNDIVFGKDKKKKKK